MPQEHITKTHEVIHIILEWWELTVTILLGIFAALWWSLSQVFATKRHVDSCKDDVTNMHNTDLRLLREENKHDHDSIHVDIKRIIDHLLGHSK